MPDFDHHPEALAWAEKAVAEAQRKALLSLADELAAEAFKVDESSLNTRNALAYAAGLARERAAAIPDPPAEQAHPASSPARTAAGESTGTQPGTEGEKRGTGDVSAAGTLTLPRDEWEAVKRVTALHAAAAERERIRQLAIEHNAMCPAGGNVFRAFADLLTDSP